MARLVKCRKCGAKVDIKEAFKVVVGKVNTYYCNEAEYNSILAARKAKDNTFGCINRIFGYTITNTALFKEINSLVKVYNYDLILSYLEENFDYLYEVMQRDFGKEYNKIRYFSAILNNSLADYRTEKLPPEPIKKEEVEVIKSHYKRKTKRRGLDEIE